MNKQFLKMQKLAGLITESEYKKTLLTEAKDISQEIQTLVDKNEFLKGKVKATPSDIIEGSKFVLLFSEDAAKHIAERHLDGTKPGSLFKSGVNLRDVAKKLLNIAPSEEAGGRVKWLGANGGNVGEMGVGKTSPEEVAKMKDYTMPDGQKEQVKIAPGKRKPTSEVSLITAELGTLDDGRKALSMITIFPGGTKIDGTEIPMNRGEFASKGLYFIVDSSSPLLKESLNEVLDDLKDAQTAAEFIYTQLDTYIDNNLDGYGSGYKVEEQLEKLLKLVSKKFNIPENSFKIDDKYSTDYNEYDEGTTKGEIKLNNQSILTYSSHADGYGFQADIDKNALKTQLEKLIKPTSESIKEIVNRVFTKYRRSLKENENIKDKIYDFLYSDEIQQNTGVTSFTTCDEDDWEKVKNYINGRGINGVTGKQSFLANNEDVTEQDFDKYYDEWLDYIEDQRADESRNQQDYNY